MYVSLNMDRMRVMHVHSNINVVANLVFIEAPRETVFIFNRDKLAQELADMSHAELEKLYRNLTDQPMLARGDHLRDVVRRMVESIPETDCSPFEVEVQANYCEQNGKPEIDEPGVVGVCYAKGATVPATLPAGLYEPPPRRVTLDPTSIAAPAPAQSSETPRSGSSREVIWQVADREWEKDGKPVDVPTVLGLRKKMMDILEREHNVKRATASSELGRWQKARI